MIRTVVGYVKVTQFTCSLIKFYKRYNGMATTTKEFDNG